MIITNRFMKNVFLLPLVLAACTSAAPRQDTSFSLDNLLMAAALEITDSLPQNSRVAVVYFESGSPDLSNYLIEEAVFHLLENKKLTIVNRNNLDLLLKELDFNTSGYVSDESAIGIGKMLGAQVIVSGALINRGNDYRLRLTAIQTETAVRLASSQADVPIDRRLDDFIASVQDGSVVPIKNTAVYIDEADFAFQDAYTAYMTGNYDKAIAGFTDAIGFNPRYAYAYLYRGIIYSLKRDYKQAIANIDRAVEIYPNFARAYFYRGEAYRYIRNYDKAIEDFTRAIERNQDDDRFYFERGRTLGVQEKYDQEIADYTKAIEINPNSAEAYYMRGTAYGMQGKYDLAVADWTKAISIKPDHVEARSLRGNAYTRIMGKYYQAIEDFEKILEIRPNDKEAQQMLENIRNLIKQQ